MAQEIVGVKIQVDGSQATKSVGSIKQELKEANAELIAAQKNFGDYSNEAIQAAKRVAELRDSISEAKETADLFDPGKKFQAFSGALNAVAGGFATAQGALGLFGSQSKELEQQLLKVQSALALSQGLSTITDSAKDFQRLATVVKSQVVTAFSTLKGAIIATGLGALTVAVGLLIANFDAVKKAILNAVPGLGKAADAIGKVINRITDFIGVTSAAGRATNKLIKDNEAALKASERNLELNGDKYDEFTKRKIEANNKFREQQNKFLQDETLTEAQRNEFIKQARERANRDILQSDKDRNAGIEKANEEAYNKQKALNEKRRQEQTEANKKELERRKEDTDFEEKQILQRIQNAGSIAAVRADADEKIAARQVEFQKQQETLIGRNLEINTSAAQASINNIKKVGEANKKQYEEDVKLAQQKKDIQIGLAQSALQSISTFIDQNSVAGKSIAIAQAIINTYQGASKALAQGGVFGPVAAAATIAAGLFQVKKIVSTKVPSATGSGSVGTGTTPALAAAPIGPQAPQAQITQLNQQSINQLGSATSRAYVVESDVTSSQERQARINRAARIG